MSDTTPPSRALEIREAWLEEGYGVTKLSSGDMMLSADAAADIGYSNVIGDIKVPGNVRTTTQDIFVVSDEDLTYSSLREGMGQIAKELQAFPIHEDLLAETAPDGDPEPPKPVSEEFAASVAESNKHPVRSAEEIANGIYADHIHAAAEVVEAGIEGSEVDVARLVIANIREAGDRVQAVHERVGGLISDGVLQPMIVKDTKTDKVFLFDLDWAYRHKPGFGGLYQLAHPVDPETLEVDEGKLFNPVREGLEEPHYPPNAHDLAPDEEEDVPAPAGPGL